MTRSVEHCELCGNVLDPWNGDNWDGLCPSCADAVSNYMDEHGLTGEDGRDQSLEALKEIDVDATETDSRSLGDEA